MRNNINIISILLAGYALTFFSCQKMERPALGNYPKDANAPGGPLKFFASFDGTTTNVLLNAVDSIRANFPSTNPLTAITGISGEGVQGDGTKFITYASPNDFGSTASSFTVAFWEKQNGIPAGGNAAFAFTVPSGNNQWGTYGFSMFCLFDQGTWTPTSSAKIKFYMVDDICKCDNWFTWDASGNGTSLVPNVQDNNWHHIAFVYDGTASTLTLYVDGVANSSVLSWGTHGPINIDNSKVQALNIGGNKSALPGTDLGWGQQWPGGLDQFRMYATALTASEVQALYTEKK